MTILAGMSWSLAAVGYAVADVSGPDALNCAIRC
jgi:hypothetical protein